MRIWKRPLFTVVMYLTPLNGLYFSPCISTRWTRMPDNATWFSVNRAVRTGFDSGTGWPVCRTMLPRSVGSFAAAWAFISILPISQLKNFWTGSNVDLPWLAVKLQFKTLFGIAHSITTFSNWNRQVEWKAESKMDERTGLPIVCFG